MKAIAVSAWRLLAVGIVSCPCLSSAELLSVTDTHPFSGTLAELWAGTGNGDGRVVAASWTQTVAASDVSISAAISDAHGWIPLQSGTAFLTTSLSMSLASAGPFLVRCSCTDIVRQCSLTGSQAAEQLARAQPVLGRVGAGH